jgi:hypothetical protein
MSVQTIASNSSLRWFKLARLGLLLALALLIPSLGLPQAITGPLVNALLILTVEAAGLGAALAVGMVTPMAALLRGVLPLPLLVMIPFIALGNAAFTGVYSALRARNRWLARVIGAAGKFALLSVAVTWLAARPLSLMIGGAAQPVGLPASLIRMMSWPQFVTALAGGLLAFGVLGLFKRR